MRGGDMRIFLERVAQDRQAVAIIIAGALLVLAVAAMMAWRSVTRVPCSADVEHRHYVDGDSPAQCCDPNAICWNEGSQY
jgi:hypothetical protein